MSDMYPRLRLWGESFSPSAAEKRTGIVFDVKNEPGEIARTGRYRNRPSPYGSAIIKFEDDRSSCDPLSAQSLNILIKNIQTFREAGATTIVLHCDVAYLDQCNLEMSPGFLAAIARLEIPFTISCSQDDSVEIDDIQTDQDAST